MPVTDLRQVMVEQAKAYPWLIQAMRDAGMSDDEIMRDTGLNREEMEKLVRNLVSTDEF